MFLFNEFNITGVMIILFHEHHLNVICYTLHSTGVMLILFHVVLAVGIPYSLQAPAGYSISRSLSSGNAVQPSSSSWQVYTLATKNMVTGTVQVKKT